MIHASLRCRRPSAHLKLALMNIDGVSRITNVANTYLSWIDNATRLVVDVVDAESADRVAQRRVIVAVLIGVGALADNLVLRVLLLVSLDLADH